VKQWSTSITQSEPLDDLQEARCDAPRDRRTIARDRLRNKAPLHPRAALESRQLLLLLADVRLNGGEIRSGRKAILPRMRAFRHRFRAKSARPRNM
jgi:hypothetical protein